jgi:hypothetical protein
MEEEKVWMASYNLEDDAQMWLHLLELCHGVVSRNSYIYVMDHLFAPTHSVS